MKYYSLSLIQPVCTKLDYILVNFARRQRDSLLSLSSSSFTVHPSIVVRAWRVASEGRGRSMLKTISIAIKMRQHESEIRCKGQIITFLHLYSLTLPLSSPLSIDRYHTSHLNDAKRVSPFASSFWRAGHPREPIFTPETYTSTWSLWLVNNKKVGGDVLHATLASLTAPMQAKKESKMSSFNSIFDASTLLILVPPRFSSAANTSQCSEVRQANSWKRKMMANCMA